jgi:(p)ppGpp synthase/HD superfamily hydrolase
MLERSRYPDRVTAAAVLHDVLEDTDADRSDLTARFGPEVAELVVLVSDDPSIEQATPASGLVELLRFEVEALETLPPEP